MRNLVALAIISLFTAGCAHFSNVSEAEDDIWVALSYDRGGSTEEISAKLERSVFNKITGGRAGRGWLEIEKAYWSRCGKKVPAIKEGAEWGYGNRYIIRIESIKRMIPLSAQAVRALEEPAQPEEQNTPPDPSKQCN